MVRTRGGLAATTEHDDRVGPWRRDRYTALPWSLEPTPEALAHQPQGKGPKQQQGREDGLAPTRD